MTNLFKQRPTSKIILVMMLLVGIAFLIIKFYYQNKNRSVDPRVVPARNLYSSYDRFARESALDSVFPLLDSIESIYRQHQHYQNSYEIGVLYVNRAAAWITIAMFRDSIPAYAQMGRFGDLPDDSLYALADTALRQSIILYENWMNTFDSLTPDQIKVLIEPDFGAGTEGWTEKDAVKYFKNRILEIRNAQSETPRRLSVAYTNLGILCRLRGQYEDAALHYQRAIELWDRNLAAENNLNRLLGRPLKKESWLRRMFPPGGSSPAGRGCGSWSTRPSVTIRATRQSPDRPKRARCRANTRGVGHEIPSAFRARRQRVGATADHFPGGRGRGGRPRVRRQAG